MQTVNVNELSKQMPQLIDAAFKSPLVIEKEGKPYVVMMAANDYAPFARTQRVEKFISLCDEMAAEAKSKGINKSVLDELLRSS